MAISVIFKLKEPQAGVSPGDQKETPVNLFFNYGYYVITRDGKKKYTPLKFATGEKIKPCYWKDRPVYRAKQVKEIDYQSFNTILDNIEGAAKKVFRNERAANQLPTPDQLRDLLKKELNLIPELANPQRESLNEFIDRFNKEIESGSRQTKGRKKHRYTPGTVKNYKSFKNQFDAYQKSKGTKLDFNDIDMSFYNEFVNYFTEKKQSPNNIGKQVKCLKVIMRAALTETPPLHSNNDINDKDFVTLREPAEEIYLNVSEIEKLENLNLSYNKHLDKIRDVFLIGVYTAQRFSDYSRIRKENIRTLQSGTKVIDLKQQKTKEGVIIPIMPKLDSILMKYNYSIPRTYDQKVNKYIKEIAKDAGITEMIPVKRIQGGLEIEKDYPKYKLIKTHTARRSGATNMYLAGIPTVDIMKLTGHLNESGFLKYIKVGKEETADNLSKHPYFNTHLKVAK
ncbi:MAG: phage integrase SAM-like domain-containing protein [Bacteroidia bacterium]|nr:phage integrase SAM-like domain-containing protein [Bacteroidia bacterium]